MPSVVVVSLLSTIMSFNFIKLTLLSGTVLRITANSESNGVLGCKVLLLFLVTIRISYSFIRDILGAIISNELAMGLERCLFDRVLRGGCFRVTGCRSNSLLGHLASSISILRNKTVGVLPGTISVVAEVVDSLTTLVVLRPGITILVFNFNILIPVLTQVFDGHFGHLRGRILGTRKIDHSFVRRYFRGHSIVGAFGSRGCVVSHLDRCLSGGCVLGVGHSIVSDFMGVSLCSFFAFKCCTILL